MMFNKIFESSKLVDMMVYGSVLPLREPEAGSATARFIDLLKSYAYHPKTKEKYQESPLQMRPRIWYSAADLSVFFKGLRGRVEQYIDAERMKITKDVNLKSSEKSQKIREMVHNHVRALAEARSLVSGIAEEFSKRLKSIPETQKEEYLKNKPNAFRIPDEEEIKKWEDILLKKDEEERLQAHYERLIEEDLKNQKNKRDYRKEIEHIEDKPEKTEKEDKLKEKFDIERTQTKQKGIDFKGWGMVEFTKWDALQNFVENLKHDIDDVASRISEEMFPLPEEEVKKASLTVFAGDNFNIKDVKNIDLEESYFKWFEEDMSRLSEHIKQARTEIDKLKKELDSDISEPVVDMKNLTEIDKNLSEAKKKRDDGKITQEEYLVQVRKSLDAKIEEKKKELTAYEKLSSELFEMKQEIKNDGDKADNKADIKINDPEPILMAKIVEHALLSFKRYHSMLWSVMWIHQRFEIIKVEDIYRNLTRPEKIKKAAEPDPNALNNLSSAKHAIMSSVHTLQNQTDFLAGSPVMSKAARKYADNALKSAQHIVEKGTNFFKDREKYYKDRGMSVPGTRPLQKKSFDKFAEEPLSKEFDKAFELSKAQENLEKFLKIIGVNNLIKSRSLKSLDDYYKELKEKFLDGDPNKKDEFLRDIPIQLEKRLMEIKKDSMKDIHQNNKFDEVFGLIKAQKQVEKYLKDSNADNSYRSVAMKSLEEFFNKNKTKFIESNEDKKVEILKNISTEVEKFLEELKKKIEDESPISVLEGKGLKNKRDVERKEAFDEYFHKDKIHDAINKIVEAFGKDEHEPFLKDYAMKEFSVLEQSLWDEFKKIPVGAEEKDWLEHAFPVKVHNFFNKLKEDLKKTKNHLKDLQNHPIEMKKLKEKQKDIKKKQLEDTKDFLTKLKDDFNKENFEEEMKQKIETHKGDSSQINLLKKTHKEDIDQVYDYIKDLILDPPKVLEEEAKKKNVNYGNFILSVIPGLKLTLKNSWEPEKEKEVKEFKTKYNKLNDWVSEKKDWFPVFSDVDENAAEVGVGHALIKELKENPILLSEISVSPSAFLKKIVKSHPFVDKSIEKIKNTESLHGGGGGSAGGREKILKHIVPGMQEIVEQNLAKYLKGDQDPKEYLIGHDGLLYRIGKRMKTEARMGGEKLYRGDVLDTMAGILKSITYNLKKIQISYPRGKSNRPDVFTPHALNPHNPLKEKEAARETWYYTPKQKSWGGFSHDPSQVTDKERAKLEGRGEYLFKDVPFKGQESGAHIQINSLKDAERVEDRISGLINEINKLIAPDKIQTTDKKTIYPNNLIEALEYFKEEKPITNIEELEKKRKEDIEKEKLKPKTFHAPYQEEVKPEHSDPKIYKEYLKRREEKEKAKEEAELERKTRPFFTKKSANNMTYKIALSWLSEEHPNEEMDMLLS